MTRQSCKLCGSDRVVGYDGYCLKCWAEDPELVEIDKWNRKQEQLAERLKCLYYQHSIEGCTYYPLSDGSPSKCTFSFRNPCKRLEEIKRNRGEY